MRGAPVAKRPARAEERRASFPAPLTLSGQQAPVPAAPPAPAPAPPRPRPRAPPRAPLTARPAPPLPPAAVRRWGDGAGRAAGGVAGVTAVAESSLVPIASVPLEGNKTESGGGRGRLIPQNLGAGGSLRSSRREAGRREVGRGGEGKL